MMGIEARDSSGDRPTFTQADKYEEDGRVGRLLLKIVQLHCPTVFRENIILWNRQHLQSASEEETTKQSDHYAASTH